MAQIIINIPQQYVDRVLASFAVKYPIPKILNPEYDIDNPSSYSEYIDEYTFAVWAKMKIIEYIKNVAIYEEKEELWDEYKAIRNQAREVRKTAVHEITLPSDLVD